MAADDPPHDRVKAEPVSIIHVVVSAKASENRLTELPYKTVATVLPATGIREHVPGHLGKFESVIEFSVGKKTSARRRSKSTRRHPSFNSPIGCAISAAPYVLQLHDSYTRIGPIPHQIQRILGKCGLKVTGIRAYDRFRDIQIMRLTRDVYRSAWTGRLGVVNIDTDDRQAQCAQLTLDNI